MPPKWESLVERPSEKSGTRPSWIRCGAWLLLPPPPISRICRTPSGSWSGPCSRHPRHGVGHAGTACAHLTLLLELGVNPKIVQDLLGHSTITLTLNTYSHVNPALSASVAARMNELFPSPAVPASVTVESELEKS
jgi:hypothetical protein